MKNKDVIKIINETLEILEKNVEMCINENKIKEAQQYIDYTTGVRMVLDNIELTQ